MNDLSKNEADSGAIGQGPTERELPVGAADFVSLRQNKDYYADKTEFLYRIVKRPYPYFLLLLARGENDLNRVAIAVDR
jgi:hypothetical protein